MIGKAVKIKRIATAEETEELETDRAKSAAAELGEPRRQDAGSEEDPKRRAEMARTASLISAKEFTPFP